MTETIPLRQLNEMPTPEFVTRLGGIFEHSPWVAEAAARQRPFADIVALHGAMVQAMRAAPYEARLALLRAHPQLAGKEAEAGTLTAHSTAEQDSVGLTRLTPDEKARIVTLNAAYLARHGFPFIIAVKLRTKSQIFAAFEERAIAPTEREFDTALAEVEKIARIRLDAAVTG